MMKNRTIPKNPLSGAYRASCKETCMEAERLHLVVGFLFAYSQDLLIKTNNFMTIIYIIIGLFVVLWIIPAGFFVMSNDIKRQELKDKEDERIRKKQVEDAEQAKLWRIAKYPQFRKEIESMPQYGIWRQAVLQKFGRKCAVCGSTENLEVDHRYKSFYEIIRKNGIMNKVQAYGCAELWDVENGAPLCKTHHDQTPSSRKYLQNNQTTI